MKKLLIAAGALALTGIANAQNNLSPWPATGNVGIGTTTPTQPLEIVTNVTDNGIKVTQSGSGSAALILNNTSFNGKLWSLNSLGNFNTHGSGNFSIYEGVTSRLFIRTTDGNVGIGSVSPSTKLHVEASSASPDGIFIRQTNAAGKAGLFLHHTSGTQWALLTDLSGNLSFNSVTSGTDVLFLAYLSKYVGIGTTNPSEKLEVMGNLKFSGALMPYGSAGTAGQVLQSSGPSQPPVWVNAAGGGVSGTGTVNYMAKWNSSTGLTSSRISDNGTSINIGNYLPASAKLDVQDLNEASIEAWSTGDHKPASLWVANSNTNYGFTMDNGNVGRIIQNRQAPLWLISYNWNTNLPTPAAQVWIGQKKPIGAHSDFRLGVYGKMVAREVVVTADANWADFVFDKDYELMPLNEVENFYKSNHHLPYVPTTTEITAKGNNLGQTDAILLRKIEELTLYIVELEKRLSKVEAN